MKTRPRVFLSYARPDRDEVSGMYRWLRKEGFDPFMDLELEGGEDWERRINNEIREADRFLACLTQKSAASVYMGKEIGLAGDLMKQGFKERSFIVPVRLEECKLLESLAGYQAVELYATGGWNALRKALPEPAPPDPTWKRLAGAATVVLLLIVAAVVWWNRLSEPDRFRWSRITGGMTVPRVGFTFWQLRQSTPKDPETVRLRGKNLGEPNAGDTFEDLTADSVKAETRFRIGAKIRLGFESTRAGFLYIVDQEYQKTGPGTLRLTFPTARSLGRGNQISRGDLIGLPDDRAEIPYWKAEQKDPNCAGETLTFLLLSERMPELDQLALRVDQPVIEGALAAKITRLREQWGGRAELVYSGGGGSTETPGEAEARRRSRPLGLADPSQETLYKANVGSKDPIVVTAPLNIIQGPERP